MSEMELNKGKIKLVARQDDVEDYMKSVITYRDLENSFRPSFPLNEGKLRDIFMENHYDKGYLFIDGDLYKIDFDIERETDCFSICDIEKTGENEYRFLTYHHNSCYFGELLEDKFKHRRK